MSETATSTHSLEIRGGSGFIAAGTEASANPSRRSSLGSSCSGSIKPPSDGDSANADRGSSSDDASFREYRKRRQKEQFAKGNISEENLKVGVMSRILANTKLGVYEDDGDSPTSSVDPSDPGDGPQNDMDEVIVDDDSHTNESPSSRHAPLGHQILQAGDAAKARRQLAAINRRDAVQLTATQQSFSASIDHDATPSRVITSHSTSSGPPLPRAGKARETLGLDQAE